ncbi:MAG: NPCBM/NEW2 domain-containing protein [Planctomycetaceae bacterium]
MKFCLSGLLLLLTLVWTGVNLPAAELRLLSGEKSEVELASIGSESIQVMQEGKSTEIPLGNLLSLTFPEPEKVAAEPYQITLRDGSRFRATGIEMNPRQFDLKSQVYDRASFPTNSISNLLFQPLDEVITPIWQDLLTKEYDADVVIIRKGDLLDRIRAVVGEIKEGKLQLILDKREVEVPLEKLFGVIFTTRNETLPDGFCTATFSNKEKVTFKSLKNSKQTWKGELVQGGSVIFKSSYLYQLDFSSGKIVYLSDLEPDQLKYKPFWGDFTWTYERDLNGDGDRLRLGKEEFDKGLWIHSRTELEYRLVKKYSRFQAVVGIDEAIAAEIRAKGVGKVELTILGDEQTLIKQVIGPTDPPQELDFDLTGILQLKIIVDYADDLDIGDHLVLGNARVLK